MSLDKHRNPNGTYNGVTMLAEMTGRPVDEISAIADAVKANHSKLFACPYHEFERYTGPLVVGREEYRCKHCGGHVNHSAYHWHEKGRRAQPRPPASYTHTPVPGATCSQVLREQGKAYPRTCRAHGLLCPTAKPDTESGRQQ